MSHITIPEGYQSLLGLYDTQKAIGLIKTIFQEKLCMALHLKRVTAPLFVKQGSGLNDDLNGVERPVSFDVPSLNEQAEVVHSLAKWKRYALYKYGFRPGQGIVTDMNAVRRDEELDNLHSIYVDQWDWERVITADQRTLEYGIHQIIAKADGYKSLTQYLRVAQESAGVDVELDKVDSDSDSDESTGSSASTSSTATSATSDTTTTYYRVHIDAPENVEVYLDGNYVGISPCSFKKTSGSHVITLRKSGYETRSYTVQVDEEKKDVSYSFVDLVASTSASE